MKAADDPAPDLKPFLEHLEDLRRMLIRCLSALGLGMLGVAFFIPELLELLKAPLRKMGEDPAQLLVTMEVAGGFTSAMAMAFWFGVTASSPFLALFIGGFVLPALTRREQQFLYRGSFFAVALFVFGVVLGYYFTLPFALQAMKSVNLWMGVAWRPTLSSYVTFCTQLLIAFGLAFELPMVLLVLGRMGIVTSAFLRDKRRHAIIVIMVIAAVLTPPDVVSLTIMSVPLYALFESCIWIIWAWEKQKQLLPVPIRGSKSGEPAATSEEQDG